MSNHIEMENMDSKMMMDRIRTLEAKLLLLEQTINERGNTAGSQINAAYQYDMDNGKVERHSTGLGKYLNG